MAESQVPSSQTFATQHPNLRLPATREYTKTVTQDKPPVLAVGTVAADGSDETDAAAVPDYPVVIVTAADGTKGVILPASGAGTVIELYSSAATNDLKVYPPAGGDINDGSANAAIILAARTPARLVCLDGVTWMARYTDGT